MCAWPAGGREGWRQREEGRGVVRADQERAEEGRARGVPRPEPQLLSLLQLSREDRQNVDE